MCFLRENKKGNQPFLFLMSSNSLMIPNIINPPPDNTSTTLNIFFIYYHLLFIIWRVIYANNKKKRISNAKRRGPVVVTEPFFFESTLIAFSCFLYVLLTSCSFHSTSVPQFVPKEIFRNAFRFCRSYIKPP